MYIITIMPVLVTILGVLAYALSSNPKVSELGRLAFFAGLLVSLFVFAGETVQIRHLR